MKNLSTGGTARCAAAVCSAAAATPAQAMACTFRPDAPDQHLVVKGDPLWDISGRFLEKPGCWPQVWDMNREQIRNPHWIYPGQIIWFDRAAGRLRLGNRIEAGDGTAAGTLRLSPQLRTEGLGKDAVPSIPSGVIEPFLTQPLIIENDELNNAPRIIAAQEGHVFLGKDDKAYVRGDLRDGTSFQVFRPGNALKDPITKAVIGYEAFYLGTLKLRTPAKESNGVHAVTVATAKEEMGVGDQLMQAPPTPMRNYVPHPPERRVEARVAAIYGGVTHAGQNQVVSVNRGKLNGLDIGSVMQRYHTGRAVSDPGASKGWHGMGDAQVKLPDEEGGSACVLREFKRS